MSAKPPILPQTKVAGVQTTPQSKAPAPGPAEEKKDIYPFGHRCTIQDRSSDPSQFFPYHVDCQCGFHASCHTAGNEAGGAANAIAVHWSNIKGFPL